MGAATVAGIGTYSAIIEPNWLEVTRVKIRLSRLPSNFLGLKIVHFSDTHLGLYFSPDDLYDVVEEVNKLQPDVICFTGDLLDSRFGFDYLPESSTILSRLKAPLGKWAILGNHDYRADPQSISSAFKKAGFHLLKNQYQAIEKGKEKIYLLGLDDVLEGEVNMEPMLQNLEKDAFKILLVHEPDFVDEVADYSSSLIDLQLSGHSHGGQIAFPLIGPVITPPLGQKYPAGLYKVKNTAVYTNRGIGTTILPFRFWCRPEITFMTLTGG